MSVHISRVMNGRPLLSTAALVLLSGWAASPVFAHPALGDSPVAELTCAPVCDPARDTIRDTPPAAGAPTGAGASTSRPSVGGYLEANGSYMVTEGITDGFTLGLPRLNLTIRSAISPRLNFRAELDLEDGGEEVELEAARLDLALSPSFVVRAGIFTLPVGAFNQNHAGPHYEIVQRPLVATEIIPATLSDVGFGVLGTIELSRRRTLARGEGVEEGRTGTVRGGGVRLAYQAYISNGVGADVLFGAEERTRIANGKVAGRLGASPTGRPSFSGRLALVSEVAGEAGVSYFGGIYNRRHRDGDEIDVARQLSITAFDYANTIGRLHLRGEVAYATIDIPESLVELFGDRQWGGYVDLVTPVLRPRVFGLEDAVANIGLRVEYVDYNLGTFASTGQKVGDEVLAIVPALSFRPLPQTVFKLNYRREWLRDRLGNPAERSGGFQVGVATYF